MIEADQERGEGVVEEAGADQEDTGQDLNAEGVDQGEDVVVVDQESTEVGAGPKSTEEEAGLSPDQDTGVRKKDPVLTRPTLSSRRYQV